MDTVPQTHLAGDADVAEAAAGARRVGRLGIDTEFMSEGRYRALLCLVQVAVDAPGDGEPRIYLIDSLTGVNVGPLAALLGDPSIEIVLHAGRQDVAILRRAWQTQLNNIFDTQIAAGFAGASAQAGYGNLLGAVLGQRVGKTASYTRWDARPLTGEQLG
jgi:ribonuclease D